MFPYQPRGDLKASVDTHEKWGSRFSLQVHVLSNDKAQSAKVDALLRRDQKLNIRVKDQVAAARLLHLRSLTKQL